jgi:hypothetical protein
VNFEEVLIIVITEVLVAIISAYLGYRFGVKQSKEEPFLPYLRKIYGIISRIMRCKRAEYFEEAYRKYIDVAVEERMRHDAYKAVLKEAEITDSGLPTLSRTQVYFIGFLSVYSDLIEVIKECKNYEEIYAQMEKEGLLEALRVHYRGLRGNIYLVHESTSYIVSETKDIIEMLETAEEMDAQSKFNLLSKNEILRRMLKLSTHNLFTFGADLEKSLEKLV